MPPKKSKASGAAPSAAAATASAPSSSSSAASASIPSSDSSERVVLGELHLLQAAQLQARSRGAATWSTAVSQLTQHCTELEKVLQKLHALQQLQHAKDKAEAQKTAKPAAAAAAAAASVASASSAMSGLSLTPSQTQLSELATWLKKEAPASMYGSSWEFESHASEEEGTGVRAMKDMEEGEQFMSIPRKVMMTTDGLASASPVGQYLSRSLDILCQQNPSLLLAVCLLYERARGEESYWASYIRCLPRRFHLPLLWSVEQVRSFLQVSPTVYDVLSLQRANVKHYTHLHEALSKGGFLNKKAGKSASSHYFRFSWADFQWAVCVLMSRQNQIPPPHMRAQPSASSAPSAADRPSVALIPGWDMMNHRGTGSIATFFNIATQSSDSQTMEPVAAGKPIYMFYGTRRNAELMTYAGFVDANHRSDEMTFELSLDGRPWAVATPLGVDTPAIAASVAADAAAAASSSSAAPVDPLLKIKLMLLKKVGMNGSGFMIRLPLQDKPDGFETSGNRFTEAAAAAAASASASASGSGEAHSAEDASRALSLAQDAKQSARASFRALMHFLRVSCLSTKEGAALALKHKPDAFANPLLPSYHFLPSLYPEHDLEAFTFLHDALTAALQSYATTLEHDEAELLRDEAKIAANEHELPDDASHPRTLRRRHRLGVEMRRSEKKLLMAAIAKALEWKNAEHTKVDEAAAAAVVATNK